MTTKVLYISDDGEEFESEAECLEYENKRNAHNSVIMFTSNRLPITCGDSVTAFEDAQYLYILDAEKAKAFFDVVGEDYGYTVPEKVTEHGIYYFDGDRYAQAYEELNDKIAELEVLRSELLYRAREYITELYSKEVDK